MVSQTKDDEFDLKKIDTEIRMEKVRQNASKLTWESFNQALRRNLMGKRIVFDAEGRIDLLNAIQYLKRNMPLNSDCNLVTKMKQVADSLECGVTATDVSVLLLNAELSITVARTEEQVTAVHVKFFDQEAEEWSVTNNLSSGDDLTALRDSVYSALCVAREKRKSKEMCTSDSMES